MRRKLCWCGGTLGDSVHAEYGRCLDCGTLATWNEPTRAQLQEKYSFDGYWHETMNVPGQMPIEARVENDLRDRIPMWWDILHRHVPNCQSLLEIGCAHGMFLKYARDRGVEYVCGLEPDERTCAFARQVSGCDISACLFPFLSTVNCPAYGRHFGVVAMFDVLEHLETPPAEYDYDMALAPGGALIIQTPEYTDQGADWPQFKPGEHLWLFTRDSLGILLASCGFDNVVWETHPFDYDQLVVARLTDAGR